MLLGFADNGATVVRLKGGEGRKDVSHFTHHAHHVLKPF